MDRIKIKKGQLFSKEFMKARDKNRKHRIKMSEEEMRHMILCEFLEVDYIVGERAK